MEKINLSQIWDRIRNIWHEKIDAVMVIDIGRQLKLLNVQLEGGIKINALKMVELASPADKEIILNSISDFMVENSISHHNVVLKPFLSSYLIKRISLPAMPEGDIPEAIKWQIKEEVGFDLYRAAMDFSIIGQSVKEDGSRVLDLMCFVAPEEEIKEQVQLLKRAGLNCLAVNLLPRGYSEIISRYFTLKEDERVAVLHMDRDSTTFTIHQKDQLEFYRELPVSINKFKESLSSALTTSRGVVKLTPEEIADILFVQGLPISGQSGYEDKLVEAEILSLLRPGLETLGAEVRRSLNYFSSQFKAGKIEKILIGGIAARIPNLDKFLSKELGLDFVRISLADQVAVAPGVEATDLQQGYGSFGLALGCDKRVNLLPYEFRTEKFERLEKISLRWVAFIVFSLLVFFYIFFHVGVSAYQRRLDNALLQLKALSGVREIEVSTDDFNRFVSEVRNSNPQIGLMLKKLSTIAGKEIFIENLSLDYDTHTARMNGFIRGATHNANALLQKFLQDMEGTVYFYNTSVSSVENTTREGQDIVKFNVALKLN